MFTYDGLMIRVMVVDDHEFVRRNIQALLRRARDVEVVGEAADGQEAVELAQRLKPDLILMDVSMPRMDGIQATEKIASLGLDGRVLMVSMFVDASLAEKALQCGAKGYLAKANIVDNLNDAIHTVHDGGVYLCPPIASALTSA